MSKILHSLSVLDLRRGDAVVFELQIVKRDGKFCVEKSIVKNVCNNRIERVAERTPITRIGPPFDTEAQARIVLNKWIESQEGKSLAVCNAAKEKII